MTIKKQKNFQRSRGYIALTSILVIAAVLLTIGVSVSLVAISEGQLALSGRRNESTLDVAEGCVEDALLRFTINPTVLPSSIVLPEGTCSLSYTKLGNIWTITIALTLETVTKTIMFVVDASGSTVVVTSWLEIP